MIQTLIDKQDTFELVRDQVAAILALESANQQALAIADGKDPALWELRVYKERSNPWEALRTDDGQLPADMSPVINVWYDTSNIDEGASQTIDRQQMNVTINIDVFGIGATTLTPGGGHEPGDRAAALEVQRGARLVRNILMADTYVTLGVPRSEGLIGQRQVSNITSYQPEFNNQNAVQVAGLRLALQVKVSESGPMAPGVTLELIDAVVFDEDGEVLINAQYQSTTP